MNGDESGPLPTTTGGAEPTSTSTGFGLRPARGGAYTKLSVGHRPTVFTEAGTFVLEIVSVDEYGLTGYLVADDGGVETTSATMFPWPSIGMLTWSVV